MLRFDNHDTTASRYLGTASKVVACLAVLATLPAAHVLAQGGFRKAGEMGFPRASQAAVLLPDGSVFVVSDTTAERYDPITNAFTLLGTLTGNRGRGLTATLLDDGRVLVTGGQVGDESVSTAELYDPATGVFSATGSMATARSFHTATRLLDGRVLVAGGHQFNHPSSALSEAEIYDPTRGGFVQVESMTVARQDHTATLLHDGRVLIAGGYGTNSTGLAHIEIFDPQSATFAAMASLTAARGNHTATMLSNGNVLIVGGHMDHPADSLSSAEIYDVASGSVALTGSLSVPRGSHTAARLPDGTVLVAGGYTAYPREGITLASAEIYDPLTGAFRPTGAMPWARGRFTATLLPTGDVLVAGGLGDCCTLQKAEVFTAVLVDTDPPRVSVPSDFSVLAPDTQGTLVFFSAFATDDIDGNPQLVCEPSSGSLFPIGTTTVVCTATDSSLNTATATFNVTVVEPVVITVTVDPTARVNPLSGTATLSGTASCTRSTGFFTISGQLVQSIANRANLTGEFFADISCTAGVLNPWTASSTPLNGRFKAGPAEANAVGFGCADLSCAFSNTAARIQLRGTKE